MLVTFEKEYLKLLYSTGKSDKKHRFQPEIILGFQKCIKILISATDLRVVARIPSLHLEEFKGDKKGLCSIRVNRQYRIEFSVSTTNSEPIITICNILELSNRVSSLSF